jgi:hypothetical protein
MQPGPLSPVKSPSSPPHFWVAMPALMQGTQAKASLEMPLGVYDVKGNSTEEQTAMPSRHVKRLPLRGPPQRSHRAQGGAGGRLAGRIAGAVPHYLCSVLGLGRLCQCLAGYQPGLVLVHHRHYEDRPGGTGAAWIGHGHQ